MLQVTNITWRTLNNRDICLGIITMDTVRILEMAYKNDKKNGKRRKR